VQKAAKAQDLLAERWRPEPSLILGPRARRPQELRKRKPTELLLEPVSPRVRNPRGRLKALVKARPAAKPPEQPEHLLPELTLLQWKMGEPLAQAKNNLHPPRSLPAWAALGTGGLRERQASPGEETWLPA